MPRAVLDTTVSALEDKLMRIEIFARWRGQTEQEREAQFTDLSMSQGRVGYLCEVQDEWPFATHVLVRELFADDALDEGVVIPASVLRARLPVVTEIATARALRIHGNGRNNVDLKAVVKNFVDFVSLCEAKESETGEPCRIFVGYQASMQ